MRHLHEYVRCCDGERFTAVTEFAATATHRAWIGTLIPTARWLKIAYADRRAIVHLLSGPAREAGMVRLVHALKGTLKKKKPKLKPTSH